MAKKRSQTKNGGSRNRRKRKSESFDDGENSQVDVKRHKSLDHESGTPRHDTFIQKIQARRINGRYSLLKKLGEGGFGAVYLGRDCDANEEVALKLEHKSVAPSMLEDEARRYEAFQGLAGFPKTYWYGWHDDFKVMAFELLGPSLEDLLAYCDGRFSLKTTLLLADQLLSRLEALHSQDMLHRDVKPQNFLLGCGKSGSMVFLTDFGLAHECMMERDHSVDNVIMRPPRLVGTARFASIRGHQGLVQSPADDLESLGYMMVYFMRGKLPWQGLKRRGKGEKERAVMEQKLSMLADELCEGLPGAFTAYLTYVKSLRHGERPDYTLLRDNLRKLTEQEGIEYDYVFDWTMRLWLEKRCQHG